MSLTPKPAFITALEVGGWVGKQQNLGVSVKSWSKLYVGYKYKILSNTLDDAGFISTAPWGETPARIIMHYQAAVAPDSVHVTGIDTDNNGAIDIPVNLDVQCSQSL